MYKKYYYRNKKSNFGYVLNIYVEIYNDLKIIISNYIIYSKRSFSLFFFNYYL